MSGISRGWAKRAELFRTMPLQSFAIFLAAVGLLFSAVGVVNDLFNLQVSSGPRLVIQILSSAIFSMGWAGFFSRATTTFRPLIGIVCFQILFYAVINEVLPPVHRSLNAKQMQSEVALRGVLITIFIALGYSLFLGFFRKEQALFRGIHGDSARLLYSELTGTAYFRAPGQFGNLRPISSQRRSRRRPAGRGTAS